MDCLVLRGLAASFAMGHVLPRWSSSSPQPNQVNIQNLMIEVPFLALQWIFKSWGPEFMKILIHYLFGYVTS